MICSDPNGVTKPEIFDFGFEMYFQTRIDFRFGFLPLSNRIEPTRNPKNKLNLNRIPTRSDIQIKHVFIPF